MTLEEANNRIGKIINSYRTEIPDVIVEVVGREFTGLISDRVTQTGKTATGGKFSPYSDRPLKSWSVREGLSKIARTSAAREAVEHPEQQGGYISYKQFRELSNLQTAFKNFEYTGEMWRGFGVVKKSKSADKIEIELGGKSGVSQERIDWMSEQEGQPIIEPSEKEIDTVKNDIEAVIYRYISEIWNGQR